MNIFNLLKKATLKTFVLYGAIATVGALLILGTASWRLYKQTSNLLDANLRGRLLSIVTTSVVEFDPHDVMQLHVEEDWKKPVWAKVVHQMEKIRKNNSDILFMYMFRKTDADPTKMEFVSDSHSIDPYAKIDLNGDGEINDSDLLQYPGQEYPTAPEEAFEAYNGPITNKETYSDQWGPVLTGYAPLKDEKGNVVAVLAVDIRADDFATITRQTLVPFLAFSAALVGIILLLSGGIIFMGRTKIGLLEEIDQTKNQVIHTVAHQLQGIVTAFKWSVEILREDAKSREECAVTIENETAELNTITNLFLTAARIHDKKVELQPVPVDLNDFFQKLVHFASKLAQDKEKPVHLKTSIPTGLPTVLLDDSYTHFSIENLLSNAIKYTPKDGNVDLTVEIKNQILYCTVKDTGLGIPKADADKMFGQMYRASNVKDVKGTGLGLYIAKYAIVQQGGKIWYESEGIAGKGTTFFVELPLKLATNEAKTAEKKKSAK